MSASRLLYSLAMVVLVPFALLRLVWRARRQPAYLQNVAERFGYYRIPVTRQPLIWIHAVSVGETRAAQPLVEALMQEYTGHRILITHMTPTGRETGEALFGDRVLRGYLPYDYPGAVRRFLDHFRPQFGVLMETEIWCNVIHACNQRQIPVYLVNARLSEKSLRGYQRFATLMRASVAELAGVAAQTEGDAKRLQALGASRITVTGNLKFDVTPPEGQIELGRSWRTKYGTRPVLLAASTRDGEEALLLDALDELRPVDALLVIVPRHPQRFDTVAEMIERRGLSYQRRSSDASVDVKARILLGDSMGEMFAYYAACDIAFVGGSLVPVGGQNLIEACAVGKPVIIGPSDYNFAEAAAGAVAAGAAVRANSAVEVMQQASRLLADSASVRSMGEAGHAFAATHRGATERVVTLLASSVVLRDGG